jgi:hypothetical protein
MRKSLKVGIGCLATALVSGLVLIIVLAVFVLPKMTPRFDANIVILVELGIRDFMVDYPDQVPETGDNATWAALLNGRQMEGLEYSRLIHDGKLISLLLVPLKIETIGTNQVTVVSAGTDRKMGTEDDIDSVKAQEILEALEAKAMAKNPPSTE